MGTKRTASTARCLTLPSRFSSTIELLIIGGPTGMSMLAAFLELIHQRLRDALRRAGDDDRIEGRLFRPALIAIAAADKNIGVAQALEIGGRAGGQRLEDLDRIDIRHQPREHGGLIARTGADFQHPVASGCGSSCSVMKATIYGCEIVCP